MHFNVNSISFILKLSLGSIYDIWYFDLTTNKWEIVIHSTETGLSMNIDTGDSIHPGARRGHISWYDFDENKVYIYGGFGYKGIKCMKLL